MEIFAGIKTFSSTIAGSITGNAATRRITLQLGYEGSAAGSGDYLFSLPTGITFNTNEGYNPIYTGALWTPSVASMAPYIIPLQGGIVISGYWNVIGCVIPYSSTQYRIAFGNGGWLVFWSNDFFASSVSTSFSGTFDIR